MYSKNQHNSTKQLSFNYKKNTLQDAWVWSLVGELRSHMLHGVTEQKGGVNWGELLYQFHENKTLNYKI